MKGYKIAVIAVSAFFFLIFLFLLFYNNFVLLQVFSRKMYFSVSDKVGVNTDTDALYFGKSYPGGTAERKVDITNEYKFPILVSISVTGNISSHASVSDNDFILQPSEKKVITYYVTAGRDTPLGSSFEGETKVIIRRKLF